MPRIGLRVLIALFVSAASAPMAVAQRQVDLAPIIVANKIERYHYRVESTQSINLMGQREEIAAMMDAVVTFETTDVPPAGGGRLLMRFDALEVVIEGGSAPGRFDSDRPEATNDVYATVGKALLKAPLTLTLDADGTIERIDGLEGIAPTGVAGALFRRLLSEQSLKSMFQPVFQIRPGGEPARVGERWDLPQPGVPELDLKPSIIEVKLVGAASGVAELSVSGKAPADSPAGVSERRSVRGKATWDLREGRVKRLSTSSQTTLDTTGGGVESLVEISAETLLERRH